MRIDQCAQTAVKLRPDVFGAPKEKAAEFQKSVLRQYYLEGSPLPASPTDHHSIDMRLLQPFFGDDPALKAIMDLWFFISCSSQSLTSLQKSFMYQLNSGGHQAVADILETVKGIMPAYPRNYMRWFVVRVSFVLGILLLVFDS